MHKKWISPCYSALQGLYWASYGAIYSFATVFLLECDFSNAQIGTLVAISCILSACFQPFAAAIADKGEWLSLRGLMSFLCIITIIPMAILFFFHDMMVLSGIAYLVLLLLHLTYQPLLSAFGMQLLNQGYALDFGVARGIGSMSYAVLSFFLGTLTVLFGVVCLPVIGSILYGLMFLLLQTFPKSQKHHAGLVQTQGTWQILQTYPRFGILCLGIVLVFISHSGINMYMIQILERIGKGNAELGQLMSYTAVLEFIVMLLFARMTKGRDYGTILKITSIFFVLKAVFVALASNLLLLYMALLTQLCSFALFTPASVYYANLVLDDANKVKGQALITIAITIGNIIGSFLCGTIAQVCGITTAIWVTAVLGVIGTICFWSGAEKTSV